MSVSYTIVCDRRRGRWLGAETPPRVGDRLCLPLAEGGDIYVTVIEVVWIYPAQAQRTPSTATDVVVQVMPDAPFDVRR